jgi:hypothetical protein
LGVFVSVLLHAMVVAGLFVTFTKKYDMPTDNTPIVPVDLVTVGEQTNIAPQVAPEPVAPPEPQMLEPAPQDVQAPKIEVAPEAKPTPAPEKPKSKKDQFAALLDQLTTTPPANAKPGSRTIQGVGAQTAMTADLASILQSQIYRCWSPPVGGPEANSLIVTYEVVLNKDGMVKSTQLRSAGAAPNTYRDAANNAANRAIYACQPYRLPPERYNQWRDFNFVFDPRYLSGQ